MSARIGNLRGRYGAGIIVLALVATLALALPAAAAACGEEGTEDTGPLVRKAHLTPASVTHEGGTAVVTGEVEDDCGIQQVYAEVTSTEGAFFSVQMLPFEVISGNSIIYRGEFQVPANFQEWEVGYQVNVSAEDTNGAFQEAYAGEVDVEALPPFDEAPTVWEPSVSPRQLTAIGGAVTIRASAADTRSVSEVYATITPAGGSSFQIAMEPTGFTRFEGAFDAPGNAGPTPVQYTVEITALDDIGQPASVYAGQISVAAPPSPICSGAVAAGNGSMSALQRKAQQLWANAFSTEICPGAQAPRFNPTAPGSSADFIGTEAAPTAAGIAALTGSAGAKLAAIPVAQTSIAIIAHPPSGCAIAKITNRQLEHVFRGDIQRWSQLQTATGSGCDRPITRVVPSVAVGIASQFKDYLARMNGGALPCVGKTWRELRAIEEAKTGAPNTTWPEGCPATSPVLRPDTVGGGVAQEVKRIGGTIGFAGLPEAEEKGAGILALENDGQRSFASKSAALAASYAGPTAGGIANCGGISYDVPVGARRKAGESGLNADWSQVFGANPAVGGASYPLCMLTYSLAFHDYHLRPDRTITFAREQSLRDYLKELVVSPAGQALLAGPGSGYAPLPSATYSSGDVLAAAQFAAGKISY